MAPIASTIDRYAVSAATVGLGAVTVGDSDRGRCREQFNAMTTAHDVADTYRPMWDAVTAEGSVGVMGSYNAVGSSSPHSDPVPVKLPHHCWHLGFRSSKSAGNISSRTGLREQVPVRHRARAEGQLDTLRQGRVDGCLRRQCHPGRLLIPVSPPHAMIIDQTDRSLCRADSWLFVLTPEGCVQRLSPLRPSRRDDRRVRRRICHGGHGHEPGRRLQPDSAREPRVRPHRPSRDRHGDA